MELISKEKLVKEMREASPNAYTVSQMMYLAEHAPVELDLERFLEKFLVRLKEKVIDNTGVTEDEFEEGKGEWMNHRSLTMSEVQGILESVIGE